MRHQKHSKLLQKWSPRDWRPQKPRHTRGSLTWLCLSVCRATFHASSSHPAKQLQFPLVQSTAGTTVCQHTGTDFRHASVCCFGSINIPNRIICKPIYSVRQIGLVPPTPLHVLKAMNFPKKHWLSPGFSSLHLSLTERVEYAMPLCLSPSLWRCSIFVTLLLWTVTGQKGVVMMSGQVQLYHAWNTKAFPLPSLFTICLYLISK